MTEKIIKIGGASGAWGDSPMAIAQLLRSELDYLMMDYLAEVTMSLLSRAKMKDPEAGFPPDFVAYLKPHLATIAQRRIGVVSNAGGMNPMACKKALDAICAQLGLDLRIAVVEGDDLLPMAPQLHASGIAEVVTRKPLPDSLLSANAYLGAIPIATALSRGADIVITGRCVDSALALGILLHEFEWHSEDYDLLAAGSLVGHLLECGPQVTGGISTDWEDVPDWHNIGYPIAECHRDGSFVICKPEHTGGLINPTKVAEQVLYEVGDPSAYLLPDVTADFSAVNLQQIGPDRVLVNGARGRAPTSSYKVSATYQDGFRAVGMVSIVGFDAVRKAERTAQALIERARMLFADQGFSDFSNTHVEVLGAESCYGTSSRARASREVILRIVVDHREAKALDVFARQLGAVGLSFAQGTTGLIGGRPKPTPLVRLYTFFIEKSALSSPVVLFDDSGLEQRHVNIPVSNGIDRAMSVASPVAHATVPGRAVYPAHEMVEVALREVAFARSGDKGDSSNIAIFCRRPEFLPYLRQTLTAERMAAHFSELVDGAVVRYEAPGLHAFNFLMQQALGGGGMASPRLDAQGKAYGQRALEMLIPVPQTWLKEIVQ